MLIQLKRSDTEDSYYYYIILSDSRGLYSVFILIYNKVNHDGVPNMYITVYFTELYL